MEKKYRVVIAVLFLAGVTGAFFCLDPDPFPWWFLFVVATVFCLEFVLKSHLIPCILCLMLLAVLPFWGIRPGWQLVFLLVYMVGFGAVVSPGERKGAPRQLSGRSGLLAWGILTVAMGIALPITFLGEASAYDLVYQAEGALFRTMNKQSGRASELVSGGKMNRGNLYATGSLHLVLECGERPTETLYLKGFSGGEYLGGDWIAAEDEEDFVSLYYNRNYVLQNGMVPTRILTVIPYGDDSRGQTYAPYYSREGYAREMEYEGVVRLSHTFYYYEMTDMVWSEEAGDMLWDGMETERQIQEHYQEGLSAYTQVPTQRLPRLTQLAADYPLEELEEITEFIRFVLYQNTSYTTMPGWSASDQDMVEYFLFENGRGYCEHFAATATLLYRLYGIPARYVTGYMVIPEVFGQEGSSYKAYVTDEAAHAWVEIYREDYGWTPVEMTPSAYGIVDEQKEELLEAAQVHGWDLPLESLEEYRQMETDRSSRMPDTDWEGLLWMLCGAAVGLLGMLPLLLYSIRRNRQEAMEQMDGAQIYARMMDMLYYAGYLQERRDLEPQEIAHLTEDIPGLDRIDRIEVEYFCEIAMRAAYSVSPPDPEETTYALEIYRRTAAELSGKMTFAKRWCFRYLRGFE